MLLVQKRTGRLGGNGLSRSAFSFSMRRNSSRKAPATLIFTKRLKDNTLLPCVFAKCQFSDNVVGPVWSHSSAAVKCALALLTARCDCPSKFHEAREARGTRLPMPSKTKPKRRS